MDRLRKRVADRRVTRLVGQFLKAGVLAEDQFHRTDAGTPQGGIISPLLANIALAAIEERYERWVCPAPKGWPPRKSSAMEAAWQARTRARRAGICVFFPVRYADDFVVLVSGTQEEAVAEKAALADHLRRTTGLELSPDKTKVTAMTSGFEFLGFRFGMHWDDRYGYGPRVQVPKAKVADLRRRVKQRTGRDSTSCSFGEKLQELNPILRGWAEYYRYCVGASKIFASIDWYVSDRLWRWQRKKRPTARAAEISQGRKPSRYRRTRRVWQEGDVEQWLLGWLPIGRYRLAWMRTPDFAMSSGEPDADRKTHVRFGERRWETDR